MAKIQTTIRLMSVAESRADIRTLLYEGQSWFAVTEIIGIELRLVTINADHIIEVYD